VRVSIRFEVIEDGELDLVPRNMLKAAIRRIRDDPVCGKPLARALAGCRSVRVGGSENRLVYRLVAPDLIEVIGVGRRRDDEVYDEAATRV
jgi:mRNA-degrading endonuclease RelE of RelBE toxin-antitoxin system